MNKLIKLINFFLLLGFVSCQLEETVEKPNILFIAVDDLRPELGCYGQSHIISPNIDKLASGGLVFQNAYCNVPVCGASRASLLTGIRPSRNRFVDYHTYAKNDVPDAISLPEHFKNNGYYTVSLGKVFHHIDDIPESWSEKPWSPADEVGTYLDYASDENKRIITSGAQRGLPYDAANVSDAAYFDGQLANKAIETLRRLKKQNKPFFLGTGFFKPHLPFNAPQKYWDLYSEESIHLPDNYFMPENAPDAAIHNFGELRSYYGVPEEGPVSEEMARQLIHGYYACVSYTDAQIGKLIQALEDLDLAKNTIIVLWGDHGWQLGEHTLWCKHANFKTSLNAPLIIKAPGFKGNQKTEALVEFVDIFPSLCELSRLEKPSQLQGQSFVPLMIKPELPWKKAVYSRFIQGESVKTQRYLFTEWIDKQGETYATMLYDHQSDPEENKNISGDENIADIISLLRRQLHENINNSKEVIYTK